MKTESSPQHRLDSWKSIAQHFDRSSRTVQRWHAEYQLPVYRLGGDRGSVFAYVEELDEWMRHRGRILVVAPPETNLPTSRIAPQADSMTADLNPTVDCSLISAADRARSDDAVALAHKMWETLSNRNIMAISRLFREGIELNPRNAMAFAGLSHALIVAAAWGLMSAPSAYAAAEEALRQAFAINAELVEVRCAAACLKLLWRRDWEEAVRDFDELLERHPPTSRILMGRALAHLASGDPHLASVLMGKAEKLHALNSSPRSLQCWITYLTGEYAHTMGQIDELRTGGLTGPVVDAVEALTSLQLDRPDVQIERIQALIAQSPQQNLLRGALGYAYAAANQCQRANEIFVDLKQQVVQAGRHGYYAMALVLIGLKRYQEAIPCIEQSYRAGSIWSLAFLSDPILAPLRSDPEFQQFLTRAAYPTNETVPAPPIPIRRSEPWTPDSRATAQA